MNHVRDSILATLAYYDVLDFPLTLSEIYNYLINPEKLSVHRNGKSSVFDIKVLDIAVELDNMARTGVIGRKNDFYFLSGRDALIRLRIEREKIATQKWKKLLRIAKWFQTVPYLRGIMVSGSLAINNTSDESDFDVLVVAKSGRLYTCRIFLSLVASLFGSRRTRYQKIAPDKFCFNHYITDGNLNINHESLFNAQAYINLKPVMVEDDLMDKFYMENNWLGKYIHNFAFNKVNKEYLLGREGVFCVLAKFLEIIFNSKVGDWIEILAKKYQQKRIKNNPVTYESGGRVIFNDTELEFHPHSFELFAINQYNKKLKQLGIIQHVEEKDSGLLGLIN